MRDRNLHREVLVVQRIAAVLAVLLLASSVALANDSSFGAAGTPYPRPTPSRDIRMVSESVTVRLSQQTARVTCLFVLANEGGSQRVRIGFPEETFGDVSERGLIRWFRSYVNDRPVAVKRVVIEPVDSGGTFAWWIKEVAFARGETKRIRNEYEIQLSENVLGIRWFSYILRTGASWKGRIGRATVTVDLGPVDPRTVIGLGTKPRGPEEAEMRLTPAGATLSGRTLRWQFTNFEPTRGHDVLVAWRFR